KNQPRLVAKNVPKQACGFIPSDHAERVASREIKQIHEMRIVLLSKIVHRATDEPMRVQFPPQCQEFAAPAISQDRLGNAERSAKASDDAAHSGHLHLRSCIAYKVDFPASDPALPRHQPPLYRDASSLPFQRLHPLLLQKTRQAASGIASVLANYA